MDACLPRPSEIDARVLNKGEAGHALVTDGAGQSFWSLPRGDAIAVVRAAGEADYGFISGHASAAMAFVLALVALSGARRRWIWTAALGWALLMGISRMYLGRHFLADVLGGWLVGALAAWGAWWLDHATGSASTATRQHAWLIAIGATAAFLLLSVVAPFGNPGSAGEILAVLVCLYVVGRCGDLDEGGTLRRVLCVALALALGFGADALLARAWDYGGWPARHPVAFPFALVGYIGALLGAYGLARLSGLYRRVPNGPR